MALHPPIRGRVGAFDPARGIGVVVGDDGTELAFHCTRLTDGSRTVEPGTAVVFEVGAGAHPGSWEATVVVKVGGSDGGPPQMPAPPRPMPR